MNKELHCITNKGKAAKNEWKNDDSDILRASYSFYIKKNKATLFPYLLINLFKQRYISSVKR